MAVACYGQRDALYGCQPCHEEAGGEAAQELFKEAREAGKPELLITDGLQSYHKAFNREFYDHHQESAHVVVEGLPLGATITRSSRCTTQSESG